MIAAELAKIRALPTPKVALAVTLGLITIASVAVGLAAPGGDNGNWYYHAPELAVNIAGTITAMVLGAWILGVEFSSRTVRLAATVQPARGRLLTSKAITMLLLVAGFSVVVHSASYGAQALMAQIGGVKLPAGEQLNHMLAYALIAVLWAAFAFALVLLFQSYTAGLIAAIVLALGVDNLLQIIPKVGNYTFGVATNSISNTITGSNADLSLHAAIITTAVWLLVLGLLGSLRFAKRDLR